MSGMAAKKRQSDILEWLADQDSLSIQQMVDRFGVSAMTIHRDLDKLVAQGYVRKVRGGVLPGTVQEAKSDQCVICGKQVPARTRWALTTTMGERRFACCSHCGLLHLAQNPRTQSALAIDFLYGRMVNVFQAFYVIGSDVGVCCVPSALCFALRVDAERFQSGFGGEIMDFPEAIAAMSRMHQTIDSDKVITRSDSLVKV
jgi:DeoR family transcriptional regulator, copper-sensing transcriptional repressor